jgi:hypothetical protein
LVEGLLGAIVGYRGIGLFEGPLEIERVMKIAEFLAGLFGLLLGVRRLLAPRRCFDIGNIAGSEFIATRNRNRG